MSYPYRPDHRIRSVLEQFGIDQDEAITPLSELKQEIHQYGKRRCDNEASRDNLVYYLGFAFEVNRALDLDSLAFAGLLSLPTEAFSSLFDPERLPTRLIDALRYALAQPAVRDWARAQGTWLQWKRLEAIYRREVDDFRSSDAFDRTGWRRKTITPGQHYLIGEIHRILGVPMPSLSNRGQAYEFIAGHGGNPRFLTAPPVPTCWWED